MMSITAKTVSSKNVSMKNVRKARDAPRKLVWSLKMNTNNLNIKVSVFVERMGAVVIIAYVLKMSVSAALTAATMESVKMMAKLIIVVNVWMITQEIAVKIQQLHQNPLLNSQRMVRISY